MTVVSRSIPFVPVSGGTLANNSGKTCSAVRLTPTRMVVVYNQASPGRRVFSIVDNPDGLNAASTPTVYNAVYNDVYPMGTAGSVKMLRLNDSTFLLAYNPNNSYNWSVSVFTITGNTISLAYSTTWVFGNMNISWDNPLAFGPAQQPIAFIPLGDNTVLINDSTFYNYTSGFGGTINHSIRNCQYFWNGTTLTLISDVTTFPQLVSLWGINNDNNWVTWDVYYVNIPGSTSIAQVIRGARQTTPRPDATGFKLNYVRYINKPATGNVWTMTHSTGGFLPSPDNFDVAFSDPNTRVVSDWATAYYVNSDETARDPSYYQVAGRTIPTKGGGIYATGTVGDMALSTPFTLPFDTNYHAVVDRRHFVDPNQPFQMKVVRREDTNTIVASPASTGPYGFAVNVPKINVFWDKPRPFVVGQDIMWMGLTGNNFAYAVIKQPNLPSS